MLLQYSNIGLTSDLYNKLKLLGFNLLNVGLMIQTLKLTPTSFSDITTSNLESPML